jgi:hypothetical protein
MADIEVASLPTKEYGEVVEIRVPTRFYWNKDGAFDGIEFGEFKTKLQPWEEAMVNKCLEAVGVAIGSDVAWIGEGEDEEEDEEEGLMPA